MGCFLSETNHAMAKTRGDNETNSCRLLLVGAGPGEYGEEAALRDMIVAPSLVCILDTQNVDVDLNHVPFQL